MKKQKSDLFTVRDLQAVLNNAVIISGKPSTGEISEVRKRKLREYAQASIEIVLAHIEEGLLSPEEAVHVFSCAATYIHTKYVRGSDKLPGSKVAKELYDK